MSELLKANADLLKRQMKNQPRNVADVATAVLNATKSNEPAERVPASEQATKGRVVQRATLGDLDTSNKLMKSAVDMVHRWAARKQDSHDDASLVLVGPYGTGKTHIARAVLWSMCYTVDGKPVAPVGKFFHASDLLLKMSPTKTEWGGTDVPRPADFIGNVPILVIDDVGAEQALPYVAKDDQIGEIQARYFRVFDYCYQWRISLVITSNLSIPQLQDHIGGRCWDRLCEMAPKGFMFDLTGVPSWRQKESGR